LVILKLLVFMFNTNKEILTVDKQHLIHIKQKQKIGDGSGDSPKVV